MNVNEATMEFNAIETDNKLANDFNIPTMLKFTAPTIIMMVFMSLYIMVDGAFVSRYVGETALSALNIAYPVPSVILAFSIMIASGGSAIIAKNMGEKDPRKARENFSFFTLFGIVVGVVLGALGIIFIHPLLNLLQATDAIYDYCYKYLLVLLASAPLQVLQVLFNYYFVTAGKPMIGLTVTIFGGVSNMVLDYVFIGPLQLEVLGVALATMIGYSIPAIFGLLYFAFHRKGTLYFVKPVFRGKDLLKCCSNGSSEMVNNLAVAVTTLLFNVLMLRYAGETGVASITIILYAQYMMTSIFLGFSTGIAPVFSYNLGRQDISQLKKVFKNSMIIITTASLGVFTIAELGSGLLTTIFVDKNSVVYEMTKHGFHLFSISFLFVGYNIFASALFTALHNGKVSAILSFLRTCFFLIASLYLLSYLWETTGIFLAVPVAEVLSFAISIFYIVKLKKVYQY